MFNFNIGWDNFSKTDPNVLFIVLMGIGTVFVGLICLIVVCKLLGLGFARKKPQAADLGATAPAGTPVENKQELLAAVCAAVAEELGTDVNGIRITSFKKL